MNNAIKPLSIYLFMTANMLFNSVFADSLYYGVSEALSSTPESSSSKHSVELFNSPLSTSVITAGDIKKIGATSIPEALRLVPGVLVRELTNGQYEVHIRGFENAPTGGSLTTMSNQNTLIMIDERVVYDYFLGGLFWETLPVGIHDIERIEVIRGPSTALYGPNAVMGVIHIITKRSQGSQAEMNAVYGSHKTGILQLALDRNFESHFLRLSANIDQRNRYHSEYFSNAQQQYLHLEDIITSIGHESYPRAEKAKDTSSVSLSLYNDPISILTYDINYSHHDAWSQKAYLSSRDIPFTTNESDSDALNIKINYENIYLRSSYHTGSQKTLGLSNFDYSFDVSQTNLEYIYQQPNWSIRPGLRSDNITYNGDFIGGEHTLRNHALMLRTELRPNPDTTLVTALSYDKYNIPDKYYFNYQVSASYLLAYDTLLRVGVEKATRSSFFLNSFLDLEFTFPNNPARRSDFMGNKDAPLMSATTYEIGLRHEFSFYNWLDIEVFHTALSDKSEFIRTTPFIDGSQTVTPSTYQPTPTKSTQQGITVDWHYESIDWNLNTFITLQDTDVTDQYSSLVEPISFFDTHNIGTPKFYGGLNANWQPLDRWNLNANIYLLDKHTTILEPAIGSQEKTFLALANLTLSHQHSSKIDLHGSIKNLSIHNRSQYFHTDKIKPSFLIGIDISWGD